MNARDPQIPPLVCRPVTPARWRDVETLFGPRGACAGCWCMVWRLPRSQWTRQRGEGNRRALGRLVTAGPPPGLLAYQGTRPVGWCAIAPREAYPALERSRILARVDEQPVWSISCLFVARDARRRGVSRALIDAAARWAGRRGAQVVEGYPVEPRTNRVADVFLWTGSISAFRAAGFTEVARRSPTRPIVRREVRVR